MHRKLINRDSLIRNGIVVIICVLGMGSSLWFALHDLNSDLQEPGKKPMGTVYWVTNDVMRLSIHRLQWNRLERYSPIYDGDIVSSGVFSEVKINFDGGEKLELSQNTSVRIINQDSNAIRFVLREGEIQIESNQKALTVSLAEMTPVETVISDLRISLIPGTIAGIKAPGGNLLNSFILKVYQGSGTFVSKGVSRTIETGEAITFGNDGLIRADLPVTMLTPRNGTRLLQMSRDTVPVEFQWKQWNSSGSGIALEIAQTKDLSGHGGNWYWENTDSAVIELSEGTYYWKIYSTLSREEADSGRLDIIYTQSPRALSPADGTAVLFQPGKREICFSWAVPEEAEAVLLEVAGNSEMDNPRIQQLIKGTSRGRGSYTSTDLGAGAWYWRVYPVFAGWTDHPSPVNSFVIEESTELFIQKPVSSAPAVKSGSIPHLIFPPDNYTLEANRTPDLLFTWENTISNNARFQMSEFSDFTRTLIIDNEVYGSNLQSPFLAPGTYYWRIAGAAPENTSHPNRLVITSALPGPVLESPQENERLVIQEGVAVIFSWNQVNYANYYQFNLFLEGREIPLSEISFLQNNSIYVYFDPNTQGRFTWTVQGFISPTETATGRNGLIANGRFYITPEIPLTRIDQISWAIPRIANMQAYAGEVDSPITLIAPIQGLNIPGIQALRSPPQARWVSDVPLRNIQLIISRTTDPSSDPMSIVRNVSGSSAAFPSLGEGVWYWIIRGDTSELRGTTPGYPFWVNVLPIPLLQAPHPIQPEIDSVIGLEQLTKDRNITFQWNSVEGANAYIFSLYQDDTTPKLIFTASPQTELSYVFDNISLFNYGNYFWQIEAVYRDRNDVIEQRGGTVQNPFSIEFQRSDNIRTTIQGTQYGQ